jgi:hypothetical protein
MPSESGVTSSSSTFFSEPLSMPAWMTAPSATASSGFLRGVGLATEDLRHKLPHERHACAATDEDHGIEFLRLHFGIAQSPQAMRPRASTSGRMSFGELFDVSFPR